MIFKLKIKFVLMLTLCSLGLIAQQDPQFTNYMYNTLSVNSAYAGSRGHLSILALHRTQWVGIDGAPQSQTLSIQSPVGKNVGVGLSIVKDQLGPSKEHYLDANVSYTVKLSDKSRLSFGMKGGGRLYDVDLFDGFQESSDVTSINSKFLPTIGAGLYWRNEKSYVGFAIPNFLTNRHYDFTSEAISAERLHYYFIAGKVFNISEGIKFKPSFLGKFVTGAPIIADISANVMFYESFRLGLAYRWDDSVSALVGLQATPQLLIGYAYDLTTTGLGEYNSGTHEIMLRYELITKEKQLKSPRFF